VAQEDREVRADRLLAFAGCCGSSCACGRGAYVAQEDREVRARSTAGVRRLLWIFLRVWSPGLRGAGRSRAAWRRKIASGVAQEDRERRAAPRRLSL
jgi:hypothetical protein